MKPRSKSESTLQNCSIREIYNIATKAQLRKSSIQGYRVIKKSASDYLLNKKKVINNAIYHKPIQPQKAKKIQAPLPGPGYYFKSPTFIQELKNKQKEKKLSLNLNSNLNQQTQKKKQKKTAIGPGSYNIQKFQQYLNNRQSKEEQKTNTITQRVLFTEECQARSIQIPQIGQYNIGYAKCQQKKVYFTKRIQKTPSEWIKLHKSLQKKQQQKQRQPSPQSYNPIPRSFSLFSNMSKKLSKGFQIHQKQRREKSKQNEQKNNFFNKKINKKKDIGPGKYLSLQDWNNKIKDKKGWNFVSGLSKRNVYY